MDIIQCNLLVKTKRKWKSRWVVLRRVSPASERISLYVYKDRLSAISKQKEKLFFPLREFCGMESIDKEHKSPKLIIITTIQPLSLRFDTKEDRDHWVDTIVTQGNFGEDVSFDGILPSRQPLKSGEVTLHIYPDFFALVRKQNCRCLGRWNLQQLFNYDIVDGGFVFQVESELEKGTEPESFLLLTSFEKQINRAFDTVYKTARNVYGSAEGLHRRSKSNSHNCEPTRRPRSMSEPSGFKRFMHRLSFRRKSRRPKKSKWQSKCVEGENDGTPRLCNVSSLSKEGSTQEVAKDSTSGPSRSASLSDGEHRAGGHSTVATSASVFVEVRQNPVTDNRCSKQQEDGKPQLETTHLLPSPSISTESDVVPSGEHSCESRDKGDGLQAASAEDDLGVWQRRSALLPNTDDMIQQGFIKTKPQERRSSDSSVPGAESNNNSGSKPGGLRPARSNTIGSRRKMPNLRIEISLSGSDPSLNQYVNVAQPVQNKQIPKLKQGEWDRYDSDENVYHRVEAVVGPIGYENVKSKSVTSLNNSYRNLPATFSNGGHSYENVSGADTGRMHYVNVEAKKRQNVNYIRVEGSGPSTPVQTETNSSPVSRKPNVYTHYMEIDQEKTRQLRELAERRVERVKNN